MPTAHPSNLVAGPAAGSIVFDPPLPPATATCPVSPFPSPPVASSSGAALAFTQQLSLLHGGRSVATLRWHCRDPRDGIIQILDLTVAPDVRRQGIGRLMVKGAIEQARNYHAARKLPLRRAWLLARQKSDIIARAFLTSIGFHHVASLSDFLEGEEGLLYTKSFD
jgi:ribosomal protein S18 acetylase RimI-like enzyme